MKVEKQTIGIFILLVPICIALWVDSMTHRKLIEELLDDQQRHHKSSQEFQFDLARHLIDQLEKNEVVEAKYLLFTIGKMNYPREVSPSHTNEFAEFDSMYSDFMREQCSLDHFKSCVSYGGLLEQAGNFDLAYEAYIKGAQSGDLWSISALVGLYRNSGWSSHSEIKAKEWLLKLGK